MDYIPGKILVMSLPRQIAQHERDGIESTYYERWLATLEKLLIDRGLTNLDELNVRTLRQALEDEHDHDHSHPHELTPNQRSLPVERIDGKVINVVQHRGHLLVCSKGCCCGITERYFAHIPEDLYHQEWENRKLRNRVHLTQSGCLGPCSLANVVLLFFDGQPIWFQSVNTTEQIIAIFDYIESMLEADQYLLPPSQISDLEFNYYTWSQ